MRSASLLLVLSLAGFSLSVGCKKKEAAATAPTAPAPPAEVAAPPPIALPKPTSPPPGAKQLAGEQEVRDALQKKDYDAVVTAYAKTLQAVRTPEDRQEVLNLTREVTAVLTPDSFTNPRAKEALNAVTTLLRGR